MPARLQLPVLLGALLAACGPAPTTTLELEANPRSIGDQGQTASVSVTARVGQAPGAGSIHLVAAAGDFADQGKDVVLPLDAGGRLTVDYRCVAAADPGCMGTVRLTATWDTGQAEVVRATQLVILAE